MKVSPAECGRVLSLFRDAVEAREPEVSVHANYKYFVVQGLLYTFVGVSRGYTDYYQGRGQAIRPTAALINIHEPLI